MTESPCINVCTLDPSGKVCLGCFRTLDEIGNWPSMAERERREVAGRLAARRLEHEALRRPVVAAGTPQACSRCGTPFSCGANDPDHPCWCGTFPAVAPTGADARCLCPACLAQAAGAGG